MYLVNVLARYSSLRFTNWSCRGSEPFIISYVYRSKWEISIMLFQTSWSIGSGLVQGHYGTLVSTNKPGCTNCHNWSLAIYQTHFKVSFHLVSCVSFQDKMELATYKQWYQRASQSLSIWSICLRLADIWQSSTMVCCLASLVWIPLIPEALFSWLTVWLLWLVWRAMPLLCLSQSTHVMWSIIDALPWCCVKLGEYQTVHVLVVNTVGK